LEFFVQKMAHYRNLKCGGLWKRHFNILDQCQGTSVLERPPLPPPQPIAGFHDAYERPSWYPFTKAQGAEALARARAANKAILDNQAIRLAAATEEKTAREAKHLMAVRDAGGRKHWELNEERLKVSLC
jgi:hypothetical protein